MADDDYRELMEGFKEAVICALACTSAYEKHASRHRSVGRAVADPFYSTRIEDFKRQSKKAQEILIKYYKKDDK